MRSKFDSQLATLSEEMTQMGAYGEEVIALAAKALREGEAQLGTKVADIDSKIDRMASAIESLCFKLIRCV